MDLEKEVMALRAEVKRLSNENASLAKLVNNHARLIDRHSGEIKEIGRNFKAEINRIAVAFKKVQSILNRGKE